MSIPHRNHQRLLKALYEEYETRFPNSRRAHARASEVLIDGISHAARLFEPYPFRAVAARGARVYDYW